MADYNFTRVDFKEIINGTYFEGHQIQLSKTIDEVTEYVDITDAIIDIWFRDKNDKGKVLKKISTSTSEITILDGTIGLLQIEPFVVDFGVDLIYYDIRIEKDIKPKYYIYGFWPIKNNSTKWIEQS
jgi:hypothetical protein